MSTPRIAIFGAGAIGLYLAARLADAGIAATLVTRPGKPRLPTFVVEEGERTFTCTDLPQRPADQPLAHDFVIVTTKAQDLPAALPEILPWLGDDGQLVIAQNGLPWWFLDRQEPGSVLRATDPDGQLLQSIDLQRTITCVINKSVDRVSASHLVAFAVAGDRWLFGRPQGAADDAVARLVGTLQGAGLPAEGVDDIVTPLWDKLLGNVVLNPLSAITGLDLAALLKHREHYQSIVSAMQEAQAVARAYGLPGWRQPEERLARTAGVAASGHFRTSMLQDRAAGRAPELEPIVGAVRELARRRNLATPTLDRLYAEARQLFSRS
jgi:2-dehydropantoate 2-reductase